MTDKASSSQKGESLEDTIKTLNYYADAIVLRHPEKGSAKKAAQVSKIPIINAGDGNGEHPTQALLDIMTIYTELQERNIDITSATREPITITFVGDLKNSRTIHSLIHILALFPNMHFIFIAPPSIEMPEEIIAELDATQIQHTSSITLNAAIPITDVLYMTRIQKERFQIARDYYGVVLSHNYKNYCIKKETIQSAKPTAIIMHPLPRSDEIHTDVDDDPRAMYMTQVENGLYMRMAILETIFSKQEN
jgi:aspartate carbamoyltransferase